MKSRVALVGVLLFGSGLSALVYQTVWLRQFRLIFGSSTAATAAVLAIFLGGLGAGSLLIGRRVDRFDQPLRLYGFLELAIAVWTALTPLLIAGAGALYFRMGGSPALGMAGATVVRVLLAVLILGPATVMMGGTLPAATRAVETASDARRKRFALVYGLNTLGAVAGTLVSTFVLLETFGNRYTLWLTCLFNVLVALAAIAASRTGEAIPPQETEEHPLEAAAPVTFVCAAAAMVGFVFMMLELVWYRALAPVLGGTTFTFGLILGVALLGIGAGSCVFLLAPSRRSTLRTFALTCAAEAFFVIVPFAVGDEIVIVAAILRTLRGIGFEGLVAGWAVITAFVVFVPAFMAGIQFPILVSLLGEGRKEVGSHVGLAYAWNTAGSVVGAAATGMGLLPLLSVNGAWRTATIILAGVALLAASLAVKRREHPAVTLLAAALAFAAIGLSTFPGPSAAWRHSPIGAGRVDVVDWDENQIRDFINYRRRAVTWERDGIESSVGLSSEDGYALLVNGKSDGHARVDAGTQVMSGLLGALLHPAPRNVMVVGLGTGTTAGWLASVPEIRRVDVVEIEPAIVEAAPFFESVNQKVVRNPKAKIVIGDAREVLLASDETTYDVIVSEPSNPYRAGVASLFTTDFYENVRRRLSDDGLFLQWMQAYEIDLDTLRTVYASYLTVFPHVTTWQTQRGDLLLVGSFREQHIDADRLRARIAAEPFRSALQKAWRVEDVEGVLAHYIAGTRTARKLAEKARLNTDDRTVIEFGFARTVGDSEKFDLAQLKVATAMNGDRVPRSMSGSVDRWLVAARRQSMVTATSEVGLLEPTMPAEIRSRLNAHVAWVEGRYGDVLAAWEGQPRGPSDTAELVTFAEALADVGAPEAQPFIGLLRFDHPIEADVIEARMLARQKKPAEAVKLLERAFVAYRTDPWPLIAVMHRALQLAGSLARDDQSTTIARQLHEAVRVPFCASILNEARWSLQLDLARMTEVRPCGAAAMAVLESYEPNVPWTAEYLELRAECYSMRGTPLADRAARDLALFREHSATSVMEFLREK